MKDTKASSKRTSPKGNVKTSKKVSNSKNVAKNKDINPKSKKVDKIMVNKKKKRKRIIKVLSIFITLGILISGIYLLFTLPYFNLTTMEVKGTEKYTKDEVIGKSGIEINKNIFKQFIRLDKNNIITLPYINSVNVKINLPNKLELSVTERTSRYVAYNKEKNEFYRISNQGYILEKIDINEKTENELLLFSIIFDDEIIIGSKINDIDISKLKIFEKVESEFKKLNMKGSITKVNFENSLTTITINDKLNAIFPNDTELEYKMKVLEQVRVSLPEDVVGTIDLTKTNAVFTSF